MIYVSYGITKSASTFVYQLTEEILTAAGRRPAKLSTKLKGRPFWENYIDPITGEAIENIRAEVGENDVVIKAHGAPDESVAAQVRSGRILASAVIRDPREIALALIDHGRRSLSMGVKDFSEFEKPLQTLGVLKQQVSRFAKWRETPGLLILTFDEVCFGTRDAVRRIADQLNARVDPDEIVAAFADKSRIGQFNLGVRERFRTMDSQTQRVFLREFADLYRDFFPNAAVVSDSDAGVA